MNIYKHAHNWYVAQFRKNGRQFTAFGRTHAEAILNCFADVKYQIS